MVMPYYFANFLYHPEKGFFPAFPEEEGFLLLAEPSRSARWALYQCGELLPDGEGYTQVPEEFEKLLMAAEEYPPALALARDEFKRHPLPEDVTRAEFVEDYSRLIQSFLDSRGIDGFIQAKAIKDELGYLNPGEIYWIVQYDPVGFIDKVLSSDGDVISIWRYHPAEGTVSWVSDDYHIYRNPASHFDLTESQLKNLTPPSVSPPPPRTESQKSPDLHHTPQ